MPRTTTVPADTAITSVEELVGCASTLPGVVEPDTPALPDTEPTGDVEPAEAGSEVRVVPVPVGLAEPELGGTVVGDGPWVVGDGPRVVGDAPWVVGDGEVLPGCGAPELAGAARTGRL